MQDSKKAELGKCIIDMYKFDDVIPKIERDKWRIVVDGGMRLHKITWEIGSSFSTILDSYVNYVNGIGEYIDIMFDGYLNSNTKDHCHRRRYPIQSTNIEFTSDMKLDCKKDLFLSNCSNKQSFINLLVIWLKSACYIVTM